MIHMLPHRLSRPALCLALLLAHAVKAFTFAPAHALHAPTQLQRFSPNALQQSTFVQQHTTARTAAWSSSKRRRHELTALSIAGFEGAAFQAAALLVLTSVVAIHEAGHFVAARSQGIRVKVCPHSSQLQFIMSCALRVIPCSMSMFYIDFKASSVLALHSHATAEL
jgi:hypothetical protein